MAAKRAAAADDLVASKGAVASSAADDLVDVAYMRRALALAERFRGRTAPNPIVGCVIVGADGRVLAEGAHAKAGTAHAERVALDQLGGKAPGATMYVTLEPCTHQGRTPPCAPAVIAAGVARVVVGSAEPIAAHAGGMAALAKAKIRVARALVAECDAANRPFFTLARLGRPMFTVKAGVTLDGKIATRTGESQWITSEAARADAHRLRDTHDAVLAGIGTVLADDPRLTARVPGGRDPVRVVVDSELRTPPKAKLLPGAAKKGARTIIATTARAPEKRERALAARGAEIWRFAAKGAVPLAQLAKRLGDAGLTSVLVEGGAAIHASIFAAGLADAAVLYVAPIVVGGPAPSWVGGAGVAALAAAHRLRFTGTPVELGGDLRIAAVAPEPW